LPLGRRKNPPSDNVSRNPARSPSPVRDASPLQLVGMAYELAIRACKKRDAARSEQAIRLLRDVMSFAGPEDSSALMTNYDWCVDRIHAGEFALAAQTLSDLRRAWEEAERRFPG
jgi:flagellin-specific chaperone FliS